MSPAAAAAFQRIGKFFASTNGIIIIVIIVVLVWVYFSGRKKGKQKAADQIQENLKTDVDPKLLMTETGDKWSPAMITDRLYKDIYSGIFTPRDVDAYKILLAVSDAEFKAVHNDWMTRYFQKDKETLKKAIDGENSVIADWVDIKKAVLARFTKLGLS